MKNKNTNNRNKFIIIISLVLIMVVGLGTGITVALKTDLLKKEPTAHEIFLTMVDRNFSEFEHELQELKDHDEDLWLEVLNMLIADTEKKLEAKGYGIGKLDIIDTNISRKSYDSKYVDVEFTVQNKSEKDITYVKIDIYLKDSMGNIVSSTWTNDSSRIKPEAQQIITKMVEVGGWDFVSGEIAEYKH